MGGGVQKQSRPWSVTTNEVVIFIPPHIFSNRTSNHVYYEYYPLGRERKGIYFWFFGGKSRSCAVRLNQWLYADRLHSDSWTRSLLRP